MVQFDAGEAFGVEIKVIVGFNNILKKLSEVVGVVYKNLQQVFNFNFFV
jgi:hypothetical protein